MTLTKLMHAKEDIHQTHLQVEETSLETEQILHLKRLLVTLKQHYEKSLSILQTQLQAEQHQRLTAQNACEHLQIEFKENQKFHEEELLALREQQIILKELLQKAQDELKREYDRSKSDRNEQLELPFLLQNAEEVKLENEQLREALDQAEKKQKIFERELIENKQQAHDEIEHLRELLELQREQKDPIDIETVVSQTSSLHLRRELEQIKQTLIQGSQEAKALEMRYIEVLNEKIGLEYQSKQFQQQIEHQSSNLTAFQMRLHEVEKHKQTIEASLAAKEVELASCQEQIHDLQKRIQDLNGLIPEKEFIQDKYEQLKDEWLSINERLEEELEGRLKTEHYLAQIEAIATHQEKELQELTQQLQVLQEDSQGIETDRDQLKMLLEESETRLRVAQQHLAKKVKEAALLTEKVEEQQTNLTDFLHTVDHQKTQLTQLYATIEFYQKQEKRLQEQLHDALKGSESQAVKWEEKYFNMYDKWQECEIQIRELKKFEEKHQQMQNLLANLGNFMGNSLHPPQTFFYGEKRSEESSTRHVSFETPLVDQNSIPKSEGQEERYDLFGIRHAQD